MASKRLFKELSAYRRDGSPALTRLEPKSDDDLFNWTADLQGPEGTPYEGGIWTLSIAIPQTYPNTPPTITFLTRIVHANVNFSTGEICLDLLKTAWTPAYSIVKTLEAVQMLLASEGNPDSPLNIDVAKLLRAGDVVGAEGLVRFYTRRDAMGGR